jgi:hypothetical protein
MALAISYKTLICHDNQQELGANAEHSWCLLAITSIFAWTTICCIVKSDFTKGFKGPNVVYGEVFSEIASNNN